MKFMLSLMCCILAPVLAGCDRSVYDPDADEQGHSAPTQATIDANRQVYSVSFHLRTDRISRTRSEGS